MYKKYNAHTIDYQVMKPDVTPGVNDGSIEDEVRSIIEKKGVEGWMRVGQCAREYEVLREGNYNTRKTRFYRWRTQVEKGKVGNFQILKFPNNLSFIGHSNSNPKKLASLLANDDNEGDQQPSFSDFFYSNAFMKLEEISNLANGCKAHYACPDKAFLELTSFIATLPRELKEKIKPLQDQAINLVTKHGKKTLQPKYYGGEDEEMMEIGRIPDKELLSDCYTWVLRLVNEVSSLLHEHKDNLTLFGLNQANDKSK
jgi:hypothetical protein